MIRYLRKLEKNNGRWSYKARVRINGTTRRFTGDVADYPLDSQVKRAIMKDIKRQRDEYIEKNKGKAVRSLKLDTNCVADFT